MNNEQYKQVVDALVKFVVRVSDSETTSETEVEVLPEVVKLLLETS